MVARDLLVLSVVNSDVLVLVGVFERHCCISWLAAAAGARPDRPDPDRSSLVGKGPRRQR